MGTYKRPGPNEDSRSIYNGCNVATEIVPAVEIKIVPVTQEKPKVAEIKAPKVETPVEAE